MQCQYAKDAALRYLMNLAIKISVSPFLYGNIILRNLYCNIIIIITGIIIIIIILTITKFSNLIGYQLLWFQP